MRLSARTRRRRAIDVTTLAMVATRKDRRTAERGNVPRHRSAGSELPIARPVRGGATGVESAHYRQNSTRYRADFCNLPIFHGAIAHDATRSHSLQPSRPPGPHRRPGPRGGPPDGGGGDQLLRRDSGGVRGPSPPGAPGRGNAQSRHLREAGGRDGRLAVPGTAAQRASDSAHRLRLPGPGGWGRAPAGRAGAARPDTGLDRRGPKRRSAPCAESSDTSATGAPLRS